MSLTGRQRFEESRSLLLKTMPVARRVLGEGDWITLQIRLGYAEAFYQDPCATLDDVREAMKTLEDTERITRRVLGGSHPLTAQIEGGLRKSRAALRARETPASSA